MEQNEKWREEFDEKFPHKIAEVIDEFGSTIKADIKDFIASHVAEAYEKGFTDGSEWNKVKERDIKSMCTKAAFDERADIAAKIEAEGINLPTGKMDSAAIEAVSMFARKGLQRFDPPECPHVFVEPGDEWGKKNRKCEKCKTPEKVKCPNGCKDGDRCSECPR